MLYLFQPKTAEVHTCLYFQFQSLVIFKEFLFQPMYVYFSEIKANCQPFVINEPCFKKTFMKEMKPQALLMSIRAHTIETSFVLYSEMKS